MQDLCDRTLHTILCLVRGAPDGSSREALRKLITVAKKNSSIIGRLLIVADGPSPHEEFGEVWLQAENAKPFSVLGDEPASTLLVRPDLYLGYRCRGLQPDALEEYLALFRLGRTS